MPAYSSRKVLSMLLETRLKGISELRRRVAGAWEGFDEGALHLSFGS